MAHNMTQNSYDQGHMATFLTLHRAYSSSATMVLMSPVVELVIRETSLPFRLAEDSGLACKKIK